MPEPMRYQNNAIQSNLFLVQDRTETMDAGMSMPALVLDGDAQQLSNSNLDNTWPHLPVLVLRHAWSKQ